MAPPIKHGGTVGGVSKLYGVWSTMVGKCRNQNHHRYAYYGGRGIKVCERWLDFKNFKDDMGNPPPGHSIDRIDNNGNYEPSNCRWATREMQANNTRQVRFVTLPDGRQMSIQKAAREMNMPRMTLQWRVNQGYSIDKLFAPPTPRGDNWRNKGCIT
jgi:helix-turn-helix, Psq domain